MTVDSFWYCLRHDLRTRHDIALDQWFDPDPSTGRLEPGEVGRCKGGLTTSFYEMLTTMGYSLNDAEMAITRIPSPQRYCIVLQRLPRGKYQVCLLTTFGDSDVSGLRTPLSQYFGIPVDQKQARLKTWLRTKPIKFDPPWLSWGDAYIFGVPVIKKDVERTKFPFRARLWPSEVDRLRNIISERVKRAHPKLRRIRESNLKTRPQYHEPDIEDPSIASSPPPPARSFGRQPLIMSRFPLLLGLPRTFNFLRFLLSGIRTNPQRLWNAQTLMIPTNRPWLMPAPAPPRMSSTTTRNLFAPITRTIR